LLYGIAVTEFIDGKKANPTIPLIDWQSIDNNSFSVHRGIQRTAQRWRWLFISGYAQAGYCLLCKRHSLGGD
jgi:hypothetical protein